MLTEVAKPLRKVVNCPIFEQMNNMSARALRRCRHGIIFVANEAPPRRRRVGFEKMATATDMRHTAQILTFPGNTRGRGVSHDRGRAVVDLASRRPIKAEAFGAWYHDAAMAEDLERKPS